MPELLKLEIYNYSEIVEIIEQIDFNKSQNLQKWRTEINNVLYTMNQEKYMSLIKKAGM